MSQISGLSVFQKIYSQEMSMFKLKSLPAICNSQAGKPFSWVSIIPNGCSVGTSLDSCQAGPRTFQCWATNCCDLETFHTNGCGPSSVHIYIAEGWNIGLLKIPTRRNPLIPRQTSQKSAQLPLKVFAGRNEIGLTHMFLVQWSSLSVSIKLKLHPSWNENMLYTISREGFEILLIYLVASTHPKNISQIGSCSQVVVKIKNIWNHHPTTTILNPPRGPAITPLFARLRFSKRSGQQPPPAWIILVRNCRDASYWVVG